MLRVASIFLCGMILVGCQNGTQLKKPFQATIPEGKAIVEIIEEVCTIQPEKLNELRERLLYYMEYNDTTAIKDPAVPACATCLDSTARVNMINNISVKLAAQNLDRKSAIFTFNNAVAARTNGFIDDATGIAQTLVGSSGTTFLDVLTVIQHAADQVKANALQDHNEAVTRYNIFLVVSGEPNVDDDPFVTDPLENTTSILNEVDNLVQVQNDFGIFDITLNIVLITALSDNTAAAVNLYSQMVAKTGGNLVIVTPTSGGPDASVDINEFDFFNNLIPTMNIDEIIVANLNARLDASGGFGELKVDSDADGLLDEEEQLLGTNPQEQDSDNDYFDDRIEQLLGTDPLTADHVCLVADQVDSDSDGLADCVEFSLASDPLQWDSDGDRLTDYLEAIYHTNMNQADADDDMDQDGRSNIEEIKLGLDPGHAEDAATVEFFSQGYETEIEFKTQEKTKCLKLTVNNVAMVQTLSGSRNIIEVQVQEVPDNPVPLKVLRRVDYLTDGTLTGDGALAAIKIFIDPLDFSAVEQKGQQ